MAKPHDLLGEILRDGASPRTLYLILADMKREGHLKRVIQECVRALRVYPHDLHLRRVLAEAYAEDGRWPQAEAEIGEVVRQLTKLSSLFMMQAEVYEGQGRVAEAEEALKRGLALRPQERTEPPPPAETEASQEDAGAEPALQEAEEAPPSHESGIVTPTLAEIYFNQGQIQEAIDTYERVLEQEPQNPKVGGRLEELKALLATGQVPEEGAEDAGQEKKAKVINTLETWLGHIRDIIPQSTAS
jgi:predicted Zn-dependent protease